MRPLVKICGLTRRVDAERAAAVGANYLGVVLSEGFGRSVPPRSAGEIVDGLGVPSVAVLVDETPAAAAAAGQAIGASVLQLHGSEDVGCVRALRDLGDWSLWKAVRARSLHDVQKGVDRFGPHVDGLLIEGWRSGAIGGAGLRLEIDPEDVRRSVPEQLIFILAGGMTPETVSGAVARFRPDVVDVSSGVEREVGMKDHDLIEAFVHQARDIAVSEPFLADPESKR